MHDTPDQVHWHEPKAGENAGFGKFLRKPMPYDSFMEAEGVPVHRGIGVHRVQLLAVEGLRILVSDLEALDGTPVLDVKPVLDRAAER